MGRKSALAGGAALAMLLAWGPTAAQATPPGPLQITEPATDGQLVHAADVHMEASGFNDPDAGDTHDCSEWQILVAATAEVAWRSNGCETPPQRDHMHMGDGVFVNSHGTRNSLFYDTDYVVRVRARDDSVPGEFGPWAERPIHTHPQGPPGTPGAVPWVGTEPGFAVEPVATGFQLPVNLTFSANGSLLYVAELYGSIKVIRPGGTVSEYRGGLLNFDPTGDFPGSGEFGLGGLTLEPASGDLLFTTVYEGNTPGTFYGRVGRLHSNDGGLTAGAPQTILDLGTSVPAEPQAPSHQISNITVGPDGKVYVHHGDAFVASDALNINSFRGKVLRMDLEDGDPTAGNPWNDGLPTSARDYVWALGFRNPFGGDWRSSNGAHYEVENGPQMDRFARVGAGQSFGWDGANGSMATGALYNWITPHAPVNIAFVEPQTFGGSGFPAAKQDHAFVTESGPTYAPGPQQDGKRITEFAPGAGGEMAGPPRTLAVYTGSGQATAAGLAAGPDGLYFTELYKDQDASSPIDPGARVLRIRYFPPTAECTLNGRVLEAAASAGDPLTLSRGPGNRIHLDGHWCGATVDNIDRIEIRGGNGNQQVEIQPAGGGFMPGATVDFGTASEIEIVVNLGSGEGDRLAILGGPEADDIEFAEGTVRFNSIGDSDLAIGGVELRDAYGNAGDDVILGDSAENRFDGGPGVDQLLGGIGADELLGGADRDEIRGGDDNDVVSGEAGKDRLFGDNGRDRLSGGGGKDRLVGGKGRDRLFGGPGKDRCSGGKDRKKSCP